MWFAANNDHGFIGNLAGMATDATGGDALLAVMLILVVSALLSGIIDNIPYVATSPSPRPTCGCGTSCSREDGSAHAINTSNGADRRRLAA